MSGYQLLPLTELRPSPTNPRKSFPTEAIEELAESIRQHGILQPIVVRPWPGEPGMHEVVAGERRYRAARLAQQRTMPVIVRDLTDVEVLEIQLLENNQRADVLPLEEAHGIRQLLDTEAYGTGKTAVERVAEKLGRSARYVYARLQFLGLIPEAQDELNAGAITAGHADLMVRLSPEGQEACITHLLYAHNWERYQARDRGERLLECVTSVRDLAKWIQTWLRKPLADAKFDRNLMDLVPDAPACGECPYRLEIKKKEYCGNPSCFAAKHEAHVERKRAAALAEHPGALQVSDQHYPSKTGLPGREIYREVTPDTKGAVLAVVVDSYGGEKVGEVRHVILTTTPEAKAAEAEARKAQREIEDAERARTLTERREAFTTVGRALAGKVAGFTPHELLPAIVCRLANFWRYSVNEDGIKIFREILPDFPDWSSDDKMAAWAHSATAAQLNAAIYAFLVLDSVRHAHANPALTDALLAAMDRESEVTK